MMTGMCMIVSEAPLNQGKKPQRVSPKNIEMAPRMPATTILRVRSCGMVPLIKKKNDQK